MTDTTPPIEVLRAARQWAAEHRHQQPDDRMLAIVYAAGVAAGRTTAAAQLDAEAARMRRDDFRAGKVGIEYINGWEDAAARIAEGEAR